MSELSKDSEVVAVHDPLYSLIVEYLDSARRLYGPWKNTLWGDEEGMEALNPLLEVEARSFQALREECSRLLGLGEPAEDLRRARFGS